MCCLCVVRVNSCCSVDVLRVCNLVGGGFVAGGRCRSSAFGGGSSVVGRVLVGGLFAVSMRKRAFKALHVGKHFSMPRSSCCASGGPAAAAGGCDAAEAACGVAEGAGCSSGRGVPRAVRMSLATSLELEDEPVEVTGI